MADLVGPELICDAGHHMGRHGKHLRYTSVSVRPLGGQTCQKILASFWASELNQLSLDSVYASTAEQCFIKNLCVICGSEGRSLQIGLVPKRISHSRLQVTGGITNQAFCPINHQVSHQTLKHFQMNLSTSVGMNQCIHSESSKSNTSSTGATDLESIEALQADMA